MLISGILVAAVAAVLCLLKPFRVSLLSINILSIQERGEWSNFLSNFVSRKAENQLLQTENSAAAASAVQVQRLKEQLNMREEHTEKEEEEGECKEEATAVVAVAV